jgi:IclR family transcriptional regulator, mhp operon transcriptional activator
VVVVQHSVAVGHGVVFHFALRTLDMGCHFGKIKVLSVRNAIYNDVALATAKTQEHKIMSSRVNSLLKGLRVLEELNRHNGATLNQVAKITGLPRGTTYRLLETLRDGLYISKNSAKGSYALTEAVQGLSDGYGEEAWVKSIALPRMQELGARVLWPLSIAAPSGLWMLLRETTDDRSPLTMKKAPLGLRMPMEACATGRVYLAFCTREHRELLLDLIAKSPGQQRGVLNRDPRPIADVLKDVRKQGYATVVGMNGVTNLAVPVMFRENAIAGLSLRYFTRSLKDSQVVERYLSDLKSTAKSIGDAFASYNGGRDE